MNAIVEVVTGGVVPDVHTLQLGVRASRTCLGVALVQALRVSRDTPVERVNVYIYGDDEECIGRWTCPGGAVETCLA